MKKLIFAALIGCAAVFSSCGRQEAAVSASGLVRADFQTEIDGKSVDMYILKNANGMEVCLSNYGARILSIWVSDRDGAMRDVVLGFDNIQGFVDARTNMNATIGRYANRIAFGKATIDGVEYSFPINNGPHTLHSGPDGFHTKVWNAEQKSPREVVFTYTSADGEAGFPGNLDVKVTYTLREDNGLEIDYRCKTDKTTVVNMTNHAYFNLDGNPAGNNFDYVMWIDADHFTPTDSTLMTTGELLPVEGTPMDFRTPTPIGARMFDEYQPLRFGAGYDHNWVFNHPGDLSRAQASVYSPLTGILLEVYTNEPGVQFYAATQMNGSLIGKGGIPLNAYAGICLETQKFPDTANKPEWPTSLLKPGEEFNSVCVYKFGIQK